MSTLATPRALILLESTAEEASFCLVTARFLICLVETLFAGSLIAA
jgi:hypothetical protein